MYYDSFMNALDYLLEGMTLVHLKMAYKQEKTNSASGKSVDRSKEQDPVNVDDLLKHVDSTLSDDLRGIQTNLEIEFAKTFGTWEEESTESESTSEEKNEGELYDAALAPGKNFSYWYCKFYIEYYLRELMKSVKNGEDPEKLPPALSEFREIGRGEQYALLSRLCRVLRNIAIVVSAPEKYAKMPGTTRYNKEHSENVKGLIGYVARSKDKEEALDLLKICRDAIFLKLSVSDSTKDKSPAENFKEANRYLYIYFSEYYYGGSAPAPNVGLRYAKEGLAVTDPADRQNAFNMLGVCAADTHGARQLAYDTYYAWINKDVSLLAKYHGISLREDLFDVKEDEWRSANPGNFAMMLGNYAYVCGIIADTYEPYTARWKTFIELAVEAVKDSIGQRSILGERAFEGHGESFCTLGTLLSQMNHPGDSYLEVIEEYRKYKDTADDTDDVLSAYRMLCDTLLDELVSRILNDYKSNPLLHFDTWSERRQNRKLLTEFYRSLEAYRKKLDGCEIYEGITEKKRSKHWEPFFELQDYFKKDRTKFYELVIAKQLISTIIHLLERHEYCTGHFFTRDAKLDKGIKEKRGNVRAIAYYTTLNTASYLFDVMYRDSKDKAPYTVKESDGNKYKNGFNCLTLMHAHYMNDPYEGLAIGDAISGDNPYANKLFYRGNAARFRDEIYDKYFVFLKSFTDTMDDLLMWNRYGTDREEGSKDSNGCCVHFSPDSFEIVNDDADRSLDKHLLDDKDDYALYRVVYLDEQGNVSEEGNEGISPYVSVCLKTLIRLLREINDEMTGENNDSDNVIRNFMQKSLRNLLFLVKNDDYCDETEYRLLLTRTHDELDGIRLIPGAPPKLCVNPFFQVCINEITLGPNVSRPDHWNTFFRYQMSRMWRRAVQLNRAESIPDFTVTRSKIHYNT